MGNWELKMGNGKWEMGNWGAAGRGGVMMSDVEAREAHGAECEARRREEAYRVYVTDALYALCGFVGIRLKGRYCDLIRSEEAGDTGKPAVGMGMALERLGEMEIEVVR